MPPSLYNILVLLLKGCDYFFLHLLLFRMYDVCSPFDNLTSLALIFMHISISFAICFCVSNIRHCIVCSTELCRCLLLLMFQRHAIHSERFYILFVKKHFFIALVERISKLNGLPLVLLYANAHQRTKFNSKCTVQLHAKMSASPLWKCAALAVNSGTGRI